MRTKLILLLIFVLSVVPSLADEIPELPPIVAVNADNHVVVLQDGLQTVISETPNPDFAYAEPIWSPDKTKVAYVVAESGNAMQTRSIYVWDGQASTKLYTGDKLGTGFPLTWSLDSTQVVFGIYADDASQPAQDFTVPVDVMAVSADASNVASRIAGIRIAVGCGGGSDLPADWAYWADTSLGGSHEAFNMTPYGLVFSGQCVGTKASLYNFQTGETTVLADGGLGRVEISPDGSMLAAVKGDQLIRLDLQTLVWEVVETPVIPDQLAWGKDGNLFYSHRDSAGNILDSYSEQERQQINDAFGYEVQELPRYGIQVWQAGADTPLYAADTYAVGRLEVTPDGNTLIFSQISNMDNYVIAILSGTYDPMGPDMNARANYVTTDLYRIDLMTGVVATVGEHLSQFDMAG